MAKNGEGFGAAQKAARDAARKAQDGLDKVNADRGERSTSGDTAADVQQRNIDRAAEENWNAPKSPR
jgi:hypothetical protein